MSNETILIMDDESVTLDMYKSYLEPAYRVFTANSGKDGMKILEMVKPDLVLIDWMMQPMNGLDTTTYIKQHCDVPVIMISSRYVKSEIDYALDHGVNDYLVKPVEKQQLLELMRKYL